MRIVNYIATATEVTRFVSSSGINVSREWSIIYSVPEIADCREFFRLVPCLFAQIIRWITKVA